jgi:hypothetical protein
MNTTETTQPGQVRTPPASEPPPGAPAEACPHCGHPLRNERCCPRCKAPRCVSCNE